MISSSSILLNPSANGSSSNNMNSLQARPSAVGLAAPPVPTSSSTQLELEKCRFHLAELIDEVVYAENEKSKASQSRDEVKQRLSAVEACLQNFIAYTASLENSVILPAIRELSAAIPEESLSRRAQAIAQLDALQNLSARTAKLIMSLKSPPASVTQRFVQRREQILNSHHTDQEAPVDLEQAYLLVALLLEAKEELRVLMDDTVERVSNQRSATENAAALKMEVAAAQRERERVETELTKCKDTMTALQNDREALLMKLQQVAPFKELQAQYHAERDQLHTKLKSADEDIRQLTSDLQYANQTLDATKKALDHVCREKSLLEDECSHLRRQAPKTGSSMISPGAAGSGSGGAAPQRFWENQAHTLQTDMDELSRNHSTVVTRLEGIISQLRMELAEVRSHSQEPYREQITQLRKANESMHNELTLLQQQFLSTSNSYSYNQSQAASPGGLDRRIRDFEDTIRTLHTELELVEGKVVAVEKHYTNERSKLLQQFDDERRRFQQEREECDLLVLRMSSEMEQLVRENDSLRLLVK